MDKKMAQMEKIINDFMEECTKKTASPVEFDTITEIITTKHCCPKKIS